MGDKVQNNCGFDFTTVFVCSETQKTFKYFYGSYFYWKYMLFQEFDPMTMFSKEVFAIITILLPKLIILYVPQIMVH